MKKKILSLLLITSLCLSAYPNNTYADTVNNTTDNTDNIDFETETDLTINNNEVLDSDNKYGYITMDSDFSAAIADVDITDPIPDNYIPYGLSESVTIENNTKHSPTYRSINLPGLRCQGTLGTCWAFATIGACEANLLQDAALSNNITYDKDSIDLSEGHLAYFALHQQPDIMGNTTNATNKDDCFNFGGNYASAAITLMNWMGLADESLVPYESIERYTELDPSIAYNSVAHVQNAYRINIENNPDAVKQAIMDNGAVGITYTDDNGFTSFIDDPNEPDGIRYTNCYYYEDAQKGMVNHAVMVIGWDDNFSRDNFEWKGKPEHDGAWLIKNSWYSDELRELNQPEECHHGYFWMSYDEQSIAPSAYVFDAVSNQDTENYYDNNYQYDEGYLDCAINNETNTITCANVYEVKGNTANNYGETLKAISFETYDNANVNYKIEIYKKLKDRKNPRSGLLKSTTTGQTTFEGFYTIPLSTPVYLNTGELYSIVVTLTSTDGEPVNIGVERNYKNGYAFATIYSEAGQSFYIQDGAWRDLGAIISKFENAPLGNNRIKGYTVNNTAEVANSIPSDYNEGETGEKEPVYEDPEDTRHEHNLEVIDEQSATCTFGAYKTYKCTGCEYITTEYLSEPLGHDLSINREYTATCVSYGYKSKQCSRCNYEELLTEPTLGDHKWIQVNCTNPTCKNTGKIEYRCLRCPATKTDTLQKTAHSTTTVIKNQKQATCTEAGYSGDIYCSECDTLLRNGIAIEKLAHTIVNDTGYGSTCTVSGLTDGQHCSMCNTVIVPQQVIPATGHTPVVTNKKSATYFEKGYTGDTNCSVCNARIETGKATTVKKLSSINISSVKSSKTKQISVKWKKNKDATGVEIQYSTDKNFRKGTKTVKIKKNSTVSTTIKKLTSKKKYYVRIRAYKTGKVNKKSKTVYSNWSKAKTATSK